MARNKRSKIIMGVAVMLMIVALIATIVIDQLTKRNKENVGLSSELERAKTYNRVEEGEEAVEGTDNVKFDAFFLRDLDGDGYADRVRGTCKELGKEDTLYMEIDVQTAGYLKDAKITIDGKNFYLQTALPKDEQLANNYIGNNIKEIQFNELTNGTKKLLTGIVKSGDYTYTSTKTSAIGNNINNYSREDNKIILTGTYVGEDGVETPITKEVLFTMDWYGETKTSIYSDIKNHEIEEAINEEEGTMTVEFTFKADETKSQLILKNNHVKGTIPEVEGYAPIVVECTDNNIIFNYDKETRKFIINKTAIEGENGQITNGISRNNSYTIKVTYSIEAYKALGESDLQLQVPVETYYEGYNNPNEEFKNPFKSNVAQKTVITNYHMRGGEEGALFEVLVGKYIYNTYDLRGRYIISKQNVLKTYDGESEKIGNDTFIVRWHGKIGKNTPLENFIMKETITGNQQVSDYFIKKDSQTESAEEVITNVGIYFGGADVVLGEEGWIKVYDEETGNLIETFTKEKWNKYTASRPYKYETPVKHIRVETSQVIKELVSLYIYNVKEIDSEKITEKYTQEEFEEIEYIKSTVQGYLGGIYVNTSLHQATYEAPISLATIKLSKSAISTQETEKDLEITLKTETQENQHQVSWRDGIFLVKFPSEIIDVQINNISINNTNVKLESYELIEGNDGIFIKIATNNIKPQNYEIKLNVDISADPRKATSTKDIELYAVNGDDSYYYSRAKDIYDVNNNLNTEEQVNYTKTGLSLVSPSSLLTNQMAGNYDEKGTTVISPKVADIKPTYAVIDQEDKEEQTVKVGIQLKNNYASTISEIKVLGKIPFEGNTYVINGKEIGSTYTTKMVNTGIEVPEEIKDIVKVYYSENENPNKELSDETNGWKTAEQVENWDNIKTFLIDLNNYTLQTGKEYIFYYTIKIPNGLAFNKVSYSHHGVYFCLDTENGKYRTQTEPNKLGFRIAEKYDLEIEKYQTGKNKLVAGATYSVTEIIQKEDGTEEKGETKTGVTNINGILKITNLYADKIYEIKEIRTPDDYEINADVIRFIAHVDEHGNLMIEKKAGNVREDFIVTKDEGKNYKATAKVEDEAKARLKITKKEKDTETTIPYVRYKITGYNLPETGKIVTTNRDGEIVTKGLSIGQEYTIAEVKAPEGYYINQEPITFKIVNNNGIYETQITGTVKENSIVEQDGIPTINVTLEDERIPTYDLEITKIKKTTDIQLNNTETTEAQITYLAGAKFKLYKETKEIGEYISDENGKILINNLYQYVEGKDENATYTLKEVLAPEGYAKVKDITFKVQENEGLKFINIDENESKYTTEGNIIKLTIEDSPSFKLIKKDGDTGELLPNIKFAIYNIDAGEQPARNSKGEIIGTKEIINGEEYYVVSTDNNGEITADLTEGLYKAVEVEAPDKYDISNDTYYFGIGSSREGKKDLKAEWGNAIGGNGDDQITCMTETSDGGYIVGGYFTSTSIELENGDILENNGGQDGMIIKYDSEGNVEWGKAVGGEGHEKITSISQTSDGGYIVGGYFESSNIDIGKGIILQNSGIADGMVIKYDIYGEAEWGKKVGARFTDHIMSVIETQDGGYIAIGYFFIYNVDLGNGEVLNNSGLYDGMIIKYDSEGNVEWCKAVGGSVSDQITCIIETRDGGYLVGGNFNSSSIDLGNGVALNSKDNNINYSDGMLIKYSESGEVEWGKEVGGDRNDQITCIIETSDGGIIAGGYFQSSSIDLGNGIKLINNDSESVSNDGMLIKYDKSGNEEWGKVIGGEGKYDYIRSVAETNDGGCIVGVEFAYSDIELENGEIVRPRGSGDILLIKYNKDGKVEWVEQIGANKSEQINCIKSTNDGGFIIVGNTESIIDVGNGITLGNNGLKDGIIIKYDKEGQAEWGRNIGGNNHDYITCIAEKTNGEYIIGGYFESKDIELSEDNTITNQGGQDGMIIRIREEMGVPEIQELVVENIQKEFRITTKVQEIDGIKGGTISSGE
ncbi:MAG: hypothetical protein HFJ49_00860, partial [Clostridia bacterium]|nr:hypothetical protein [Clostridia bacterium]